MPDQVKILSRQRLYDGYNAFDEIRLKYERYAGGLSRPISRELLVRGVAVSVIPYDPVTDGLILIEQFRIGAFGAERHPWLTEVVAGRAEPDEELHDVATRETFEETGHAVKRLEFLFSYLINPACSTETMHMFAAHVDASQAGGFHGLDHEDEDIRVFHVPAAEAIGWLLENKVSNANLMIALQALALRRKDFRTRWLAGAD